MNQPVVKIVMYVVFGLGLVVFGILFSKEFSRKRADQPEPITQQTDGGTPSTVVKPAAEPPSRSMLYLALMLACGIPAGLLAAKDISDFVGQQSIEYIFNDEGDGMSNPDYEAAEM